jgi:hypothetical protein
MVDARLIGGEPLAEAAQLAFQPCNSASGTSASTLSQPVQPSRGVSPSNWPRRTASALLTLLVAVEGVTTTTLWTGSSR